MLVLTLSHHAKSHPMQENGTAVRAGKLTEHETSLLGWIGAIAADARPLDRDPADDLERICDYIAQSNPDSARRIARTIIEATER